MHHGVTFNFDSDKVCAPAIFEKCDVKDIWIAAIDYYMYSRTSIIQTQWEIYNRIG